MKEKSKGFTLSNHDPLAALEDDAKLVIGQLGQSLDGRIATRTGDSKYINHEDGLTHLHRLRAHVDGVVVGVGTVNEDDPLLTVRLCEGESPVRVIIDPNGRVFEKRKLFHDNGPPCLIITDMATDHPLKGRAEIIALPATNGHLHPTQIIDALAERDLHRLLIEGGSRTLSSFVDGGCLDRLHLIVAPMVLGSGFHSLSLTAIDSIKSALTPKVTLYNLNHDVLFDCDFRA